MITARSVPFSLSESQAWTRSETNASSASSFVLPALARFQPASNALDAGPAGQQSGIHAIHFPLSGTVEGTESSWRKCVPHHHLHFIYLVSCNSFTHGLAHRRPLLYFTLLVTHHTGDYIADLETVASFLLG